MANANTKTTAPLTATVILPANITRIESKDDLKRYGVRLITYKTVKDELEAVERAGIERAYLLKSPTLPIYYLIFPEIVVTKWIEK